MGKRKTTRVRIAVAIDEHGNYYCAGWSESDDLMIADNAREFFEASDGNEAVYFVEADVPLPLSGSVEGKVMS